jgi:hypothetical protein
MGVSSSWRWRQYIPPKNLSPDNTALYHRRENFYYVPVYFQEDKCSELRISDFSLCAISHTNSIKDQSVFFGPQLYCHNNVCFIFNECIKLLGLICSITLRFFSLDCLYVLYFTLVRSRLEYASVVWNSITSTGANKLERIKQEFASGCFCRFCPNVPYSYSFALEKLSLHFLRKRRHHREILLFVQACRSLKSGTSHLYNVSVHVPTCNIRDCLPLSFSWVYLFCQRGG